ncbi:hypothetical protein FOCC_FOCC013188 [Frankliniella occidentalis]|nr:hypothetical protein FOCC_FOCC013188 [Frankliniella occidentalis]
MCSCFPKKIGWRGHKMDVSTAKLAALWSLLLLTLIFCMLPIWLLWSVRHTVDQARKAKYARVVSLLSCFAGGVFMATGLLHLFPEVDEALNKASWGHGFPVAGFLTAFGFFLVLTMEQIVLDYKESANVRDISHNRSSEEDSDVNQVRRRGGSVVGVRDHPLTTSIDGRSLDSVASVDADPHSTFRSVLLTAALSLHSVFEGLAIGLQPDVDSVMQFLLAVGLHKAVIAFGLGLNLAQSRLSLWSCIRSNLIFSVASPIGIAIGLGIEDFGHSVDESAVNGILQGLACGTFFYVTFFEVLPHELNQGGDRLLKLLAILIGFSVICGVMFLDPDASPDGGSCPRIT